MEKILIDLFEIWWLFFVASAAADVVSKQKGPNHRRNLMTGQSIATLKPPPVFQFRITTLFFVTLWAALIFYGMHVPTCLMADVIVHSSLLFAFGTIVVAIYRAGPTRASALGFVVLFFGVFYFGPLNPNYSMFSTEDATLGWLFHVVHPDEEVPLRLGGSWIAPPPYLSGDFQRICQCAVATLLGLLGSLLAQYLYATQPRMKPAGEAA